MQRLDKVIWKFDLPITDRAVVKMPRFAEVLTVQVQRVAPKVWALVDPEQPMVPRVFWVVGTGNPMPEVVGRYVGTFQYGSHSLVFHVFEGE